MACLRLKRLLEEDPVEAIVVSHKRRCLDRGDAPDQEIKTIFKYVGTVRSKDECLEAHLSKAIGQEKGSALNRKRGNECTVDSAKKCKVESLQPSKQNCFKLVRTMSEDETASAALENTIKGLCRLFDAEQYDGTEHEAQGKQKESEVITCNGKPLQCGDAASEQVKHVYDLYYSNVPDYTDEELLNDSIKIEYCALDNELHHDKDDEDEDINEIDEDSNDEMNWRNDYPDEDEFENDRSRDSDEGISKRVAAFGMGNGSYFEDSSGDEVDSEDERRFGRSYAKFRARIKARQEEGDDEDDDDDDILNNAKCGNPFAG